MILSIHDLNYSYATIPVLRNISLDVSEGEIVCLLGSSGCGKTTLLRIVAGLEKGYQGSVSYAGQDMRLIPVHERNFGLMFQDFALFPHMSVADNIAYGLKRHGISSDQRKQRVAEVLNLVGLADFGERDTSLLSGGEKQRVALARSIAPNPRLLMLDEPLGSLDASLREHLMLELRQIIKSLGVTAIYVTHDQQEAYAIADRVAVMNAGQIEQVASPTDLYYHPQTAFVASFLGLNNSFTYTEIMNAGLDYIVAESHKLSGASMILIHPTGIGFSRPGNDLAFELEGQIKSRIFLGGRYRFDLELNQLTLKFESTIDSIESGATVTVYIKQDAVILL